MDIKTVWWFISAGLLLVSPINIVAVIVVLNFAIRVGRPGLRVVETVGGGLGFISDLVLVRNNQARFSKEKNDGAEYRWTSVGLCALAPQATEQVELCKGNLRRKRNEGRRNLRDIEENMYGVWEWWLEVGRGRKARIISEFNSATNY